MANRIVGCSRVFGL